MRAMTTRPGRVGLVVLAAGLLLAGCGGAAYSTSSPPTSTSSTATTAGLPEKATAAGPVKVRVTPDKIDAAEAVFAVDLDNHQVDLTGDYAARTTLTVGGRPWGPATWTGAGPAGHHRAGTLTFTAAGAATGPVVLRIAGLPAPATLTWTLT